MERADGQDGEFEQEHDHHRGAGLAHHGADSIAQHPDVVGDADEERDAEARVEEARVRRGLLLEQFDPPLADPTPDLARDEGGEHDQKEGADFVAENSHGQACLGDGEPSLLVKLLDFGGAEGAEAEALEAIHEGSVDDKYQVY